MCPATTCIKFLMKSVDGIEPHESLFNTFSPALPAAPDKTNFISIIILARNDNKLLILMINYLRYYCYCCHCSRPVRCQFHSLYSCRRRLPSKPRYSANSTRTEASCLKLIRKKKKKHLKNQFSQSQNPPKLTNGNLRLSSGLLLWRLRLIVLRLT